ncbi:hypothetical protein BH10CYA1_BH10CYA1_31860 [soil metagenome]
MPNSQVFLVLNETNEIFAISCPASVGSDRSSDVILEHPYPEPIQISITESDGNYTAKIESGSFKTKSKIGIFPITVWTTINGRPLKTGMPIKEGDCLKVGENMYWFTLNANNHRI